MGCWILILKTHSIELITLFEILSDKWYSYQNLIEIISCSAILRSQKWIENIIQNQITNMEITNFNFLDKMSSPLQFPKTATSSSWSPSWGRGRDKWRARRTRDNGRTTPARRRPPDWRQSGRFVRREMDRRGPLCPSHCRLLN